ncbi:MAG TPA: DUF2794 domain-containing protein [Alphaproteobacteria bacterium]|jgi:hypothetical protein
MGTVYRLADYRRRKRLVCFSRHELNLLLSLYSRRVISGEWKAYAIDHEHGMAQFSIFVHARAHPLYSIVKFPAPSRRVGKFVVIKGGSRVAQADSLAEALAVFERDARLVSP